MNKKQVSGENQKKKFEARKMAIVKSSTAHDALNTNYCLYRRPKTNMQTNKTNKQTNK